MTPKNNHVTVIGLPKDTDFSRWLKRFMTFVNTPSTDPETVKWREDCTQLGYRFSALEAEVEDPWTFGGISFPRFYITMKSTLREELLAYSARPEAKDLVFHLAWYELEGSNVAGVETFKNGKSPDSWWSSTGRDSSSGSWGCSRGSGPT